MSKYDFSIKRICILGLLLAILIVVSLLTAFIKIDKAVIQFTFGLYAIFCWIIPGYGMLFVGIIYGAILDSIALSFITIPMTILINVLMFFVVKFSLKTKLIHLFIFLAFLLVYLYLPYQWFITYNGSNLTTKKSLIVTELIIDSIQFFASFIVFEILYFTLKKTKLNIKIQKQYYS